MPKTIEFTIDGELEAATDQLSEHFFPGNHYRFSRYCKKALQEKVTRDLARRRRMKIRKGGQSGA